MLRCARAFDAELWHEIEIGDRFFPEIECRTRTWCVDWIQVMFCWTLRAQLHECTNVCFFAKLEACKKKNKCKIAEKFATLTESWTLAASKVHCLWRFYPWRTWQDRTAHRQPVTGRSYGWRISSLEDVFMWVAVSGFCQLKPSGPSLICLETLWRWSDWVWVSCKKLLPGDSCGDVVSRQGLPGWPQLLWAGCGRWSISDSKFGSWTHDGLMLSDSRCSRSRTLYIIPKLNFTSASPSCYWYLNFCRNYNMSQLTEPSLGFGLPLYIHLLVGETIPLAVADSSPSRRAVPLSWSEAGRSGRVLACIGRVKSDSKILEMMFSHCGVKQG